MNTDFTTELAQLMRFSGNTATAIRMYSKYSGGNPSRNGQRRDPIMTSVDIMFLSDAITQFLGIGCSIERGYPIEIIDECNRVQKLFESYATDNPNFNPQAKPTFDYWKGLVEIDAAVTALKAIQEKAKMQTLMANKDHSI